MIHVGSGDERGALSSSWGGANGPFQRHSCFVRADANEASRESTGNQVLGGTFFISQLSTTS